MNWKPFTNNVYYVLFVDQDTVTVSWISLINSVGRQGKLRVKLNSLLSFFWIERFFKVIILTSKIYKWFLTGCVD